MGTGRTTPALCGCEDAGGNPAGDFIVKLRGGIERGGTGLAAELIASRLAAYFGIPAPSPVLVFIASDFANSVSLAYPDKSRRMAGSIGLNFGSSLWMRAEDHQMMQPIYLATFTKAGVKDVKYDVESTGYGWRTESRIEYKDTILPTTCKMERP